MVSVVHLFEPVNLIGALRRRTMNAGSVIRWSTSVFVYGRNRGGELDGIHRRNFASTTFRNDMNVIDRDVLLYFRFTVPFNRRQVSKSNNSPFFFFFRLGIHTKWLLLRLWVSVTIKVNTLICTMHYDVQLYATFLRVTISPR